MAIRKNSLPQQFVAVDCALTPSVRADRRGETVHSLRSFYAVYRRCRNGKTANLSSCLEKDSEAFWKWLGGVGELDRPVWLVGHGMGVFLRATGFLKEMEEQRITLYPVNDDQKTEIKRDPLFVLEDPPIIVVVWLGGTRKLIIVDLVNYFRTTRNELYNSLGCDYQEQPTDKQSDSDIGAWLAGNVTAWSLLFSNLISWARDVGKSSMGYSSASQAFLTFRTKFMSHHIIRERPEWVKRLEVASHYPGRVAIFSPGWHDEIVHQVDVASFYPRIMGRYKSPVEVIQWGENRDPPFPLTADYLQDCICHVQISPKSHSYPVRAGKKLRYRSGTFWTCLAGPELVRAAKANEILQIGSWIRYRMEPLFHKWVAWILEQREAAKSQENVVWEKWAKTLANSLYGKFAERHPVWESIPREPHIPEWGFHEYVKMPEKEWHEVKCIAGDCWRKHDRQLMPHAFPAICAFITSHGRVEMDQLITQAGAENVYYQAVDSLFMSTSGRNRLMGDATYNQTGNRAIREEYAAKGFSARAVNCYRHGERRIEQGIKIGSIYKGGNVYHVSENDRFVSGLSDAISQSITYRHIEKVAS